MQQSDAGTSADQMEAPLIEVSHISKSYGGVRALIDCDFSCRRGEVHALLGENGAGKSTLVKILCGVVAPDSGSIRFKGQELRISSPIEAVRQGIVAVFQELSLVSDLTVAENVYLGHEPRTKFGMIDFKKMSAQTQSLFDNFGIMVDPDELVRNLPLAHQQLAEIGKALAHNPEVIIFDEATSALGHQDVELLFSIVKQLTREGKTVIFISHKMNELAQIADRATVFRDARYVSTFTWGTVSNAQIVNWIAGRDLQDTYPTRRAGNPDEVVLDVKALSNHPYFSDVSLQVRKGEIIGIAGLQGHGQTEFLHTLFGHYRATGGTVYVSGHAVNLKAPSDSIVNGITLVPEDRKREGLLLTRSIKENLTLMTLRKRQRAGWIQVRQEQEAVAGVMTSLRIKAGHVETEVGNLSGGNQQKVVIGKAMLTDAAVLLMVDPTRGIDVGTKAEIYRLMRALADQGKAILFYSTEIPELVGLSDRVVVFKQGRVTAHLEGEDITENNIVHAALGIERGEMTL